MSSQRVVSDPAVTPPSGGEPESAAAVHRPLSRNRVVWSRLRAMPRFWVGIVVFGGMVLWAFVGPALSQWQLTSRDIWNMNMPPTMMHWFGTTSIGQDVYVQTITGLQKSLIIGLIAGPSATLIAALIGSIAGYVGGWSDRIISWFINLLLVIPAFFIFILLSPLIRGLSWIVLTFYLAVFSWMIMAQVVRSQTLSLRNRDFVKAARYMGMPTFAILRKHIIPNVASILIIDATLGVVSAIMSETSLSYFGFGIQSPDVSLGTMLADGTSAAVTRPWLFVFPAGVLIVLLFAISLVGDALRDAIDPMSEVNRAI